MLHTDTKVTGESCPNPNENTASARISLAFNHARGGRIEFDGTSEISYLLALWAMVKLRQYRRELGRSVTATDAQGREMLMSYLDGAAELIVGGIGAVGKLLALTSEELNPRDLPRIGWLVCGLAELAADARFAAGEARYEHECAQGAKDGNP